MSSLLKSMAVAVCFCGASAVCAAEPTLVAPVSPVISSDDVVLSRLVTPEITVAESSNEMAEIVARQANISNFGTACGPSLSAEVVENAMLAVKVFAPCQPYDAVQFEHEGLNFSLPLSMTGEVSFLLPALSDDFHLLAILADGTTLTSSANVPDALNFARVALEWHGKDPGELIAKAPKALDGDLIRLGQSNQLGGQILHVFSTRVDDLARSGVVRLSMRASVTAANCETGQTAHVRHAVPGQPVISYDVALKGPGCDAIGQSLELKNILQDLKLAKN